MRIFGEICEYSALPATGSMPMMAENLSLVSPCPRTRENAVWPPLLWPARASLERLGLTPLGRTGSSPSASQSVTWAAASMSLMDQTNCNRIEREMHDLCDSTDLDPTPSVPIYGPF